MPVLLLTTTGRRTGRPREVGLTYLVHGSAYVVIGSRGGAPTHPDWFLNLRSDPDATVRIGGRTTAVLAREASGDERRLLWDRAVRAYPGYADYRRRTQRTIPVVVLEPVKP